MASREIKHGAQRTMVLLASISAGAILSLLLLSSSTLSTAQQQRPPLTSLKQTLLSYKFSDCCPTWHNLSENLDIVDELRRTRRPTTTSKGNINNNNNNHNQRLQLEPSDLLNELKLTFFNVTYLSLSGQMGNNDRDKYYSLYDGVVYYLSLLKVSKAYLNSTEPNLLRLNSSQEMEFERNFRRQLRSIEFRASKDPTLSSFINELLPNGTTDGDLNPNFAYYEDFVKSTQFGQYYASRGAYDTTIVIKPPLSTAAQVTTNEASEVAAKQSDRSLFRFF